MGVLTNIHAPSPSELGFGYLTIPMAAGAKIFGGAMVAINASGLAVKASDSAGLVVVGKAVIEGGTVVDNTNGAASALSIQVQLSIGQKAFVYDNSDSIPVLQADLLTDIYVVDDHTVGTSGGSNNIVAGKFMGFVKKFDGTSDTTKCFVKFAH